MFIFSKKHGYDPNLHILDNKCSYDFHKVFKDEDITFQLVPQYAHRCNATERDIRTFKNHLITCLCTCDSRFPTREWDIIIPQVNTTLDLIRSSRTNPALSVYVDYFGAFNFNTTPLALPGTKFAMYFKPKQRGAYVSRDIDGCYIDPSMIHYRCYNIWIPETGGARHTDTFEFYPQ